MKNKLLKKIIGLGFVGIFIILSICSHGNNTTWA